MNTTHQSELNCTTTNEHRALSQEMSPGKSLLTPDQGVFKKKKEQQCDYWHSTKTVMLLVIGDIQALVTLSVQKYNSEHKIQNSTK